MSDSPFRKMDERSSAEEAAVHEEQLAEAKKDADARENLLRLEQEEREWAEAWRDPQVPETASSSWVRNLVIALLAMAGLGIAYRRHQVLPGLLVVCIASGVCVWREVREGARRLTGRRRP